MVSRALPSAACFGGREQRIEGLAAFFHHHELAADDIAAGAIVLQKFRQHRVVAAAVGGAIDGARRVAEVRSRAEFGAFGHDAGIDHSAASRNGRG